AHADFNKKQRLRKETLLRNKFPTRGRGSLRGRYYGAFNTRNDSLLTGINANLQARSDEATLQNLKGLGFTSIKAQSKEVTRLVAERERAEREQAIQGRNERINQERKRYVENHVKHNAQVIKKRLQMVDGIKNNNRLAFYTADDQIKRSMALYANFDLNSIPVDEQDVFTALENAFKLYSARKEGVQIDPNGNQVEQPTLSTLSDATLVTDDSNEELFGDQTNSSPFATGSPERQILPMGASPRFVNTMLTDNSNFDQEFESLINMQEALE
ncbi:hypothetical protein HDU99_000361, partial [Rhizoclosmatium hyalinum]